MRKSGSFGVRSSCAALETAEVGGGAADSKIRTQELPVSAPPIGLSGEGTSANGVKWNYLLSYRAAGLLSSKSKS